MTGFAPVVVPGVLVALTVIALFVVALGLTQASIYIVDMLTNFVKRTVGKIPIIGPRIGKKAMQLNRIVRHYAGLAAARVERLMAAFFRDVAGIVVEFANEIAAISAALATAIWASTARVSAPVRRLIETAIRKAVRLIPGTVKRVVIRETRVIRTTVRQVTRVVVRGGKVTTRFVRGTIPRWVRQLRKRVTTLERGHARQAKRLTTLERKFALSPFTARVNTALGRLGLGWLRCSPVNRLGRSICRGGTGWLDALLSNIVPVLFLADVCTLARVIEGGAHAAEPLLRTMIDVAEEPLQCYGLEPAPPLPLNTTALPSPAAPLALV